MFLSETKLLANKAIVAKPVFCFDCCVAVDRVGLGWLGSFLEKKKKGLNISLQNYSMGAYCVIIYDIVDNKIVMAFMVILCLIR